MSVETDQGRAKPRELTADVIYDILMCEEVAEERSVVIVLIFTCFVSHAMHSLNKHGFRFTLAQCGVCSGSTRDGLAIRQTRSNRQLRLCPFSNLFT